MKGNGVIWFFLGFAIIFFIALADVYAGERHHHGETVINVTNSMDIAVAAASGQHHYRSTNQLQWSVGSAFIDDDSAVSFGLGKQVGRVFISGNYGSDGHSSIIGFSASGKF